MSIQYDKPFKTYDEQIELIKQRNIIVSNPDFAREVLSSISYYSLLNGYKSIFLESTDPEKYIDGTSLEIIYTLHIVQNSMNNILFKYILFVENSLKTKLAYQIALMYGVNMKCDLNDSIDNYLFKSHYSNSSGRKINIILRLIEIFNSIVREKPNSSTAYYHRCKNHVPSWIFCRDLMFGQIIQWYNILIGSDKTAVCRELLQYGTALSDPDIKGLFTKILEILRDYRNIFAHGHRPFRNKMLVALPKVELLKVVSSPVVSKDDYNSGIGKSDLFSVIISILLCLNDEYVSSTLMAELNALFDAFSKYDFNGKGLLESLYLPENVIDRIKTLIRDKYSK